MDEASLGESDGRCEVVSVFFWGGVFGDVSILFFFVGGCLGVCWCLGVGGSWLVLVVGVGLGSCGSFRELEDLSPEDVVASSAITACSHEYQWQVLNRESSAARCL